MPVEQIRNIIAGGERTSRNVLLQSSGGLLEQVLLRHRYGVNDSINEMAYYTVWPEVTSYPRVLTAGALEVVSSDLNDNYSGTGARRVLLVGCDAAGDPLMEIVEMDGLTPVYTVAEFFWFEHGHVIEVGQPYGHAAGVITINHGGTFVGADGPKVGEIAAPYNETQMALTVIPNHYSGYLISVIAAGDSSQQMEFAFRVTARNGAVHVVFPAIMGGRSAFAHNNPAPQRIHYPALVEMVGRARSPSPTAISGGFTMLMVHDRYDFSIPGDLDTYTSEDLIAYLNESPQVLGILGSSYDSVGV